MTLLPNLLVNRLRDGLRDKPQNEGALFADFNGHAVARLKTGLSQPFSRQPNFGEDLPLEKIPSGFNFKISRFHQFWITAGRFKV